jgi:PadR family transcriptional regulator, regulatory protein PadR
VDTPPALSSSLRRGVLEFCVLALIEHEDRYGTELVRTLGAEQALVVSEGTVYPLLSRLRRLGWVTTSWQESARGAPRRYYALSPSGTIALNIFRKEWGTFRDAVDRLVENDSE